MESKSEAFIEIDNEKLGKAVNVDVNIIKRS